MSEMVVRRRSYRKLWFMGIVMFVAVFVFTMYVQSNDNVNTNAANLANFDAGYIISDYQMGNYNSMSEAEIQKFLDSKISCNRGESYYNYLVAAYPGYSWHFKDGHIVCMNEELFGDGETIGSGETAAHIIWQAAQDYKINPQVLIVLLQKEQGLVTDNYPNTRQYRSATGYGCPDTAPCASEYYGFKNQVRKAAAMFRTVLDGGWTNYPLGENWVRYSDKCTSGSVVNIRNLATSALYRYTPYQPNAAALAAGYGSVAGNPYETCAAYGNRNFYLYFEDWFGGITDEVERIVEAKTNYERTINDGLYQIYSKKYTDKVVDVRGGVRANMTSAETILFTRNEGVTNNQMFYVKYNEGSGYYNIINLTSNLRFDVKGGSTENSTPIIMFSQNNSCNQDWLIEKDQNGYVSFMSRCSSKVLDAASDGRIIIYPNHGGDNQKWQLNAVQEDGRTVADGTYKIVSGENVFDISGGVYDGLKQGYVIAFPDKNQENQKFTFVYQSSKKNYRIYNLVSGLYLTAGEKVIVKEKVDGCQQEWIVEQDGSKYKIYNVCNKMELAVSNDKTGGFASISTLGGTGGFDIKKISGNMPSFSVTEDVDYQVQLDVERTIDIYGGVTPGMKIANLVVFPARDSNNLNQIFRLKYNEEKDAYWIYNPTSGLYLDVAESGTKNGVAVIGFHNNGGYCNQLWKINEVDGGYEFASICSGKVLTITNSMFGASPKLVIYEKNDGLKQVWKLVEKSR